MANAIKSIYQGAPSTGGGTLATVGAAKKWIVTDIILCNTSSAAAWVSLSRVPNAGSAAVGNRIVHQVSIPAGGIVTISCACVLDTAGDFLWGQQQTSAAITVTISGIEVS